MGWIKWICGHWIVQILVGIGPESLKASLVGWPVVGRAAAGGLGLRWSVPHLSGGAWSTIDGALWYRVFPLTVVAVSCHVEGGRKMKPRGWWVHLCFLITAGGRFNT